MQKLFFLVFSVFLLSSTANAQWTITGTVLDSASREPLAAASVFCQNTTLGTATSKQGEFSLSLKPGAYDLIFSYTGYQTFTLRVTEQPAGPIEILLIKEDKSLGEVVLRNSYEVSDGLEKYGSFFLNHFIGTTPNASLCTLENPGALKFYFYKKSNRLKVLATEPLRISNHSLGYQLQYQLDSFVYYYSSNNSIYRGYCLFTELDGTDSLKSAWAIARKKAYEGSRLHFMRSYYDSTLIEEGWMIDLLDEKNTKKFNKVTNVYDSAYFNFVLNEKDSIGTDSMLYKIIAGPPEIEIYYPRKVSITYSKASPEKEYLKKMNLPKGAPYQISYIDIKDWIAITESGYYYEQYNWINQGYWSWKNLAELLPYDYLPD